LRLPRPDVGPVGRVGCALVLVGVFGAVAGFVAMLLGGLVAGVALLRIDAGRLPKTCRTLGALAAKAANLSYGRLVKQGADARDDRVWKVMVEILSDFADVPADQIVRETYFLASALKHQNAAA